jgi:putative membrane protein
MSSKIATDIAKGALAGAVGGLVASFAMNQFQAVLAKVKPQPEQSQPADDEPATVKVADAVAHQVLDRDLSKDEKDPAGNAVHYAFGAAAGALYGALAEASKAPGLGFGTLFGSVLWFLADEIAVPGLRLSKAPTSYPPSVHASAWASHMVYGITTDLVRRGLRAI